MVTRNQNVSWYYKLNNNIVKIRVRHDGDDDEDGTHKRFPFSFSQTHRANAHIWRDGWRHLIRRTGHTTTNIQLISESFLSFFFFFSTHTHTHRHNFRCVKIDVNLLGYNVQSRCRRCQLLDANRQMIIIIIIYTRARLECIVAVFVRTVFG